MMSRNITVGTVCDGVENPENFPQYCMFKLSLIVCMEHVDFVQSQNTSPLAYALKTCTGEVLQIPFSLKERSNCSNPH